MIIGNKSSMIELERVFATKKVSATQTNNIIQRINDLETRQQDFVRGENVGYGINGAKTPNQADIAKPIDPWYVNEYQTKIGNGVPLSVWNPIVRVNGFDMYATMLSSCVVVSGDWYVAAPLSGQISSVYYTNDLEALEGGSGAWSSQKVFNIQRQGGYNYFGPNNITYYNKYPSIYTALSATPSLSGDTYGVFRFTPNTGTKTITIITPSGPEERHIPCGSCTHCNVQVGRKYYEIPDNNEIINGNWQVVVNHTTNPPTITFTGSGFSQNTLSTTCIPIFVVAEQVITKDYRGMPVIPTWGNETT